MVEFFLVVHTPQMEAVRVKKQYAPELPSKGDQIDMPPYTLGRVITSRVFKATRADSNTKYVQVRVEVSSPEHLEALTPQDGWQATMNDL